MASQVLHPTAQHFAGAGSPVRLADLGQDLVAAVPEAGRPLADRLTIATRHRLAAGRWRPSDMAPGDDSPAAFVLSGVLVRDVALGGRSSSNLFGPGDMLRPWRATATSLPATTTWTCGPDGASIAVLDQRFAHVARKWPGLYEVLQERHAQQLDESTLRTAIVSLPRAEQRIQALLWQLADRWGVVRPDGVLVRLRLTHALIGRLIGARRPTVTLALQVLADEGVVRRADASSWVLAHDSNLTIERRPRAAGLTAVGA